MSLTGTLRRFDTHNLRLDKRCLFLEVSRSTRRWRHGKTRRQSNRKFRKDASKRSSNDTPTDPESTGFLTWYSSLLDSYPIITKCLTSGVIAASGDFLCQGILLTDEQDNNNNSNTLDPRSRQALRWWDYERTLRFAFLGTFLVGPCVHLWYQKLATVVPGDTPLAVVQRVILDQVGFAPIFLSTFITSLWTLEGREFDVAKLKENWSKAIVANWLLWVPAQAVNFSYIPLKYQVLYSNVVAVMWNCFLSYSQASSSSLQSISITTSSSSDEENSS